MIYVNFCMVFQWNLLLKNGQSGREIEGAEVATRSSIRKSQGKIETTLATR